MIKWMLGVRCDKSQIANWGLGIADRRSLRLLPEAPHAQFSIHNPPLLLWMTFLAGFLGIASLAHGGTLQGTVRCPEPAVVAAIPEKTSPIAPPREPAVIEQRDLRFHPTVLPVLQGTRVLFPNYDPLYHNVFSVSPARPFNLGMYGPNEARGIVFDRPGVVEVRCMVHREMVAYVVVLTTPYFQMSDPTGAFAFRDLPAGRYRVQAWSPRCGNLESPWVHVPKDQTVRVELRPTAPPQPGR